MEKIGRYSIMGELGRGSQGVIYHALDVESQRQVALKVIRVNAELADDDPDLMRLIHATEEQTRKLSEIEHRNVARSFEAGYQDGQIYIARELIAGKTLKWLMEDTGKIKIEEAVEIVKDIAKGLKAIHQLGIVLGNLQPGDIIIRPGIPVIAGYGLPSGIETEGLTKTQKLVENVIYLAPEVVEGSLPTGRSDIYSLGMLLYSMLAGGNPFQATSVANALINVRVKDFASIEKENGKVPLWLARVVNKAIAREPEKRYTSVDELLDDLTLRSILKEAGEEGKEKEELDYQYLEDVKPRRRDKRIEYVYAGFVVLTFVVIIWYLVAKFSPENLYHEEETRHSQAMINIAGDIKKQQAMNPQGFDIAKYVAERYKGDWDLAYGDTTKNYSLWIDHNDYHPSQMDTLRTGAKSRFTFTVVAYPRDKYNPYALGTFGIREDLKLRIWQQDYGKFDDVTTWKVF